MASKDNSEKKDSNKVLYSEILRSVSRETSFDHHDVDLVIKTYHKVIMRAVKNKKDVVIKGFIKIKTWMDDEKKRMNLATGKVEVCPPERRIRITPLKDLKDASKLM